MIFEVFDLNENNRRSLFGGGRYNGLSAVFGVSDFPATGFAPGSETFRIFLENWNLIPSYIENEEKIYLPLLEGVSFEAALKVGNLLRSKGYTVIQGLKQTNISQALRDANKKGYANVGILGSEELATKKLAVKDMKNGKQTVISI